MTIKVTPEFRANTLAFRAGLVVLVVIAAVLVMTFKAQTGLPGAPTTKVQAYFDNVHSLKPNDAVREDSKRIGRVSDIEFHDGRALVTMELNGHFKVYGNAKAQLWDLSALATKFVELDPGTPTAGGLAVPISAARTQDSADLYQVLDVLDARTRAAATSTIRELGTGLGGHGQDLSDFLKAGPKDTADIERIAGALADRNADLGGLVAAADHLASRFDGRTSTLADLVDTSATTLDALSVDGGTPLRQSVHQLPGTLGAVDDAMVRLRGPLANTAAAMRALDPGAHALARSSDDLRGFLRAAVPVAAKVPHVADLAVPAVSDLTTTVADARPLAPRVRDAIGYAMTPLQVLAAYTSDMSQLWLRGASFVSQGPRPGVRYARLGVTPGLNTITGGLLSSGSSLPQDNYPAPGQAQHDRATGLLPVGIPGLGH